MPPPKKVSIKKPYLIDGLTKEEISREQMTKHIVHLREKVERVKKENDLFMLETDKINKAREIADRQREEIKVEEKKLDKDMEENQQCHQIKIRGYKQKMKHLQCEHQNTISELRADSLVLTQVVQKEKEQLETLLHKDMGTIMVHMQEIDNENLVKELELKHAEEMTKIRNGNEKQIAATQAKCDKEMELLKQELENGMKNTISEKEDQWKNHFKTLTQNFNKAFGEAKALSDSMAKETTINNSLKGQIEEMTLKQKQKLKDQGCLLTENKRLAELFSKVEKEYAEIEKKRKYYTTKRDAHERALKKVTDDLERECETMEQKISKVQLEKDEMYKTFAQNIQKVQHKADLKTKDLEKKLKGLKDDVEKRRAQLRSVISASNVDQTAHDEFTNKIQQCLDSRNSSINKLQYKRAQLSQARKDLLLTCEANGSRAGRGALCKALQEQS